MKKLIFSGTGYPITIKTLQYLQDNTLSAVSAIARSKENYEVIWGMTVNEAGTQITDGALAYNGEIIPFVGATIAEGATITINEIIDTDGFNTNPSSSTAVETLPAYSNKVATIGTGGVHTFDVKQLKRYKRQVVLDAGVHVEDDESVGETSGWQGGIRITHKLLTDAEVANSMIIYTLSKEGDYVSVITGAKGFLLRRSKTDFVLTVEVPIVRNEKPKVYWQIVMFK